MCLQPYSKLDDIAQSLSFDCSDRSSPWCFHGHLSVDGMFRDSKWCSGPEGCGPSNHGPSKRYCDTELWCRARLFVLSHRQRHMYSIWFEPSTTLIRELNELQH